VSQEFSEKISTRVKDRPKLAAALELAQQCKEAAPEQPVILTVTEMKRLGRDADEPTPLARPLQEHAASLETLRGPLPGIYDLNGTGSIRFAFGDHRSQPSRCLAGEASEGPDSILLRNRVATAGWINSSGPIPIESLLDLRQLQPW
jgi:hypothetical protein